MPGFAAVKSKFIWTIVPLVAAIASTSCGQGAFNQAAPGAQQAFGATPANEITNFTGKLKGFQRGVIMVTKDDGTEAMVLPPERLTSFSFVAEAEPSFLRPGMLVRFAVNLGPTGLPIQPVQVVTLFNQVNPKQLQGQEREQFTPGVYGDRHQPANQQGVAGKKSVVGKLIGISGNGVMLVQAGKYRLQAPVNEQTKWEVRFNDLTLAKADDKVTVAGFYNPPKVNQIRADRITITTDRVFKTEQPEAKRPRKRGAKDDPADEDKADAKGDAPNEENADEKKAADEK